MKILRSSLGYHDYDTPTHIYHWSYHVHMCVVYNGNNNDTKQFFRLRYYYYLLHAYVTIHSILLECIFERLNTKQRYRLNFRNDSHAYGMHVIYLLYVYVMLYLVFSFTNVVSLQKENVL